MSSLLNPTQLPERAVSDELKAARTAAQDAAKAQQAAFQAWQDARAERDALKSELAAIPHRLSAATTLEDHHELLFRQSTLPGRIQDAELTAFDLDADRQDAEATMAESELAVRRLELDAWNTLATQVTEALGDPGEEYTDSQGIEAARASVGYSPVGHRRAIEALRLEETLAVNCRADAARVRSAASSARFERGL